MGPVGLAAMNSVMAEVGCNVTVASGRGVGGVTLGCGLVCSTTMVAVASRSACCVAVMLMVGLGCTVTVGVLVRRRTSVGVAVGATNVDVATGVLVAVG